MRRRILGATLGVLVAALIAFSIPLAIAVRNVLTSRALDGLEGETEQVATIMDERARTCGDVQLLVGVVEGGEGFSLTVFDQAGRALVSNVPEPAAAGSDVAAAVTGRAGRSYVADRLSVAVPLRGGSCTAAVVIRAQRGNEALVTSVRQAWTAIVGVGVVVLVLAALAVNLVGRRLAVPFEQLARSARILGEGDFTARAPRSGLPEAEAIADSLDSTADRLGDLLQRGSAFTADASHQLRTPLTALRLNLEALETLESIAPDGPGHDLVAGALHEADRLEATIAELVALTVPGASQAAIDVNDLVAPRIDAWRTMAAQQDRELVVVPAPVPAVHVRAAAIGQALQVLLDNAMHHGQGTVTVSVAVTDRSAAAPTVRICVRDEGPGLPAEAVTPPAGRDRGHRELPVHGGRGLPLARSLVEGEGGRLLLSGTPAGTLACIVIPLRDAAPTHDPDGPLGPPPAPPGRAPEEGR